MMASLMDGKRRAAVSGEFFGSWPTYGYDRIDGPDWRKNVNQAAILERCFREVDAGLNLQDLAKLLNGECIPARNGGIWRPRHFFARGRGLLDRPILKGVFVWSPGVRSRSPFRDLILQSYPRISSTASTSATACRRGHRNPGPGLRFFSA